MEGGVGSTEAAQLARVSTTTIANWRRQGWIEARMSPWGYFVYDPAQVARVAAWRLEVDREVARLRVPPHELKRQREEERELVGA